MKKWIKISLWGAGVVVSVYLSLIVVYLFLLITPQNDRDNKTPSKTEEMIKITLEFARLAPFPDDIKEFAINTEGSSLTRTFKGHFNASDVVINSWLEKSLGIKDSKVEIISDTMKRFIISPRKGANYAEVLVDWKIGRVEFVVSWS